MTQIVNLTLVFIYFHVCVRSETTAFLGGNEMCALIFVCFYFFPTYVGIGPVAV